MSVTDMLGGFFSRARMTKPAEKSPYVVEHSPYDKYVHDELYDSSTRFRRAIDSCPEIEVTKDDGTVVRKRVEASAGLNTDMFFAFHDRRDAPNTLPPEQIRPSREFNRQFANRLMESDDFKAARAYTRDDGVGAGFAMMAALDERDKLMGEMLKEDLERQDQMDEQEQKIAQGPPAGLSDDPQTRWEQLQAQGRKRAQARAQLDELAQQQAASGMELRVAQAIRSMADKAEQAAELWANLPGSQPGVHTSTPPDEAIELASKWLTERIPREVAAQIGRFKRDFRYKHANRTVNARETPVDVEFGNDLSRITATEMMALAMPELRPLAMVRYVSSQMLQYQMEGTAESGKGPFLMGIDFSGSMSGANEIGAKAAALALLSVAQDERRPVVIIAFDTQVLGTWTFEPGQPVDLNAAYEFASMSCTGGTEPWPAMEAAEKILTSVPAFKQADIVLITDGECYFGQRDLDLKDRLAALGVRFFGISIAAGITNYLSVMCDHIVPVADMTGPNEATDLLIQTVM